MKKKLIWAGKIALILASGFLYLALLYILIISFAP